MFHILPIEGSKPRSDSDVKLASGSGQARKPGGMGIKRDSPSGPSLLPPKKLIKPLGQTFTPLGRPGDMAGRGSPTIQICMYDEIAAEGACSSQQLTHECTDCCDTS